jgi:hypothetical protein
MQITVGDTVAQGDRIAARTTITGLRWATRDWSNDLGGRYQYRPL